MMELETPTAQTPTERIAHVDEAELIIEFDDEVQLDFKDWVTIQTVLDSAGWPVATANKVRKIIESINLGHKTSVTVVPF